MIPAQVPERTTLARALVERVSAEEMQPAAQEGYRFTEVGTTYGGVRQRWLVLWSAQAEKRKRVALHKRVEKERQEAEKAWKALPHREFPSRAAAVSEATAAEEAVAGWAKRYAFHRGEVPYQQVAPYERKGRPALGEVPQRVGWRVQGEVVARPQAIAAAEKGVAKFILATNELDAARLPAEEMLEASKGQGAGPERGFRFLKAPWFFADSLFLKSPQRMMALVMVTGLALLVYALAEHKLRTTLREQGERVPNQVGKPTQRPTMRRIFQMFEGIELLLMTTPEGVQPHVMNIKPVHRQILRFLGPHVEKCYLDTR